MKKKNFIVCSLAIVIAGFLFSSCSTPEVKTGTGGSGGRQLHAAAGTDQRVNINALVTLDGSGSASSNGQALAYTWSIMAMPASSTAALSNSSSVSPTFTADAIGQYQIQLLVSDGTGTDSSFVSVGVLDTSPTCTTDDVTGLPASGAVLVAGPSDDIVPLCSGAVVLGDSIANTILKMDVLNGTAETYQLTAAPGDLDLDAQNGFLYVAQPSTTFVTKIDLVNQAQSQLTTTAGAVHVAAGNNGEVFAALYSTVYAYDYDIALSSGGTFSVIAYATSTGYGELIAFDKIYNLLFSGVTGQSPSTLTRSSYDPTSHTLTDTHYLVDTGGNGLDLTISPDGNHVAFSDGGGNGAGYTIYDFSASDLTSSGEWNTDAYPTSADFDPTGQYLAATNGSSLQIFSVSTHALLASYTLDLTDCDYATVKKVRYSRGGKIIYLFANCGSPDSSGKLFWLVY